MEFSSGELTPSNDLSIAKTEDFLIWDDWHHNEDRRISYSLHISLFLLIWRLVLDLDRCQHFTIRSTFYDIFCCSSVSNTDKLDFEMILFIFVDCYDSVQVDRIFFLNSETFFTFHLIY